MSKVHIFSDTSGYENLSSLWEHSTTNKLSNRLQNNFQRDSWIAIGTIQETDERVEETNL